MPFQVYSYYVLLTATAFRQIKVILTMIFDRFAKYLTRQLFCVYGIILANYVFMKIDSSSSSSDSNMGNSSS